MISQLFQTLYIFVGLFITILLSNVLENKKECNCKLKVPIGSFAFLSSIGIGLLLGFNTMNYIISSILFLFILGSFFLPRVKILGGVFNLLVFIGFFTTVNIFKIEDVFNIGIEKVSMFGALIAFILSLLKIQKNSVNIIYVIGLMIFLLTGLSIHNLPLTLGILLIVSSEIINIFTAEYEKDFTEAKLFKTLFFSANLFTFGLLLLPLSLL